MRTVCPPVCVAAVLCVALPAAAQSTALAVRASGAIDEAAWTEAPPITTFVQRDPSEGAPPTYRTEARVLFDDAAIYVAVQAFDPEPEKIRGYLTRRDTGSSSDWIRVYIDSYHDKRTAYSFAVNPVGVKIDTYHFNDNETDDSWDAVWDVTVRSDPDGWRAEFRIPYSQLRFSHSGDGHLGFAVARTVARLDETTTWPLLSKSASGWVSSFGALTGVGRPASGKRLELVPYSVAQMVTEPKQDGNPLQNARDAGASVGADLKYAVTPALTLSATVNPDFGQVEADPAVVNLGAFETFFEERRPFFIEGAGNFSFNCRDCNLVYSRRIGRAPRGTPQLADGEFMVRPVQSTILGAGKLTGRIGQFSIGSLVAATQEEAAEIAFGSGRRREVVEPRSIYSISRIKREFADQSAIGLIVTTANRSLVESVSFLPSSAVTGGADFDWRLGRRWQLNGSWAASRIGGSTEAITLLQRSPVHFFQRPDGDHVEVDPLATSLGGHTGNLNFAKIAGERTRLSVGAGYQSPGFDPNDLGFVQRTDWIPVNSWLQIRWDTPGRYVRNTRINFNQWAAFNFGGDVLTNGGNFNAHWVFQNQWEAGFGVNLNARTFDDRRTRGGPGAYVNGGFSSWQYFNTDDRRAVRLNWNSSFATNGGGYGSNLNLDPSVTIRPTSALSAELALSIGFNDDDAQWVGNVPSESGTRYVFGRLDQTTTAITTRVNYTVTPNLSLQIYAQPFVSAGVYTDYKELVNPRGEEHADRYAPFAYEDDADFNVLSFRTTNVMRWEYRPGSALFVVWQHGREGFTQRGNYRFGRDFGDLFSTPSTNTLLVKLAYWFNP